MKRLRYFFSKMDKNSATYGEMYEGEIKYPPHVPGNDSDFWMTETDPVYWDGELSFAICESSRREKDRPTIKYYIPSEKLKIVNGTYVEADFCYRSLIPLLRGYNERLRNDKRPDRENGKVYYPEYFGEITVRNTAYFVKHPKKTYINLKENIIQENPDVQSMLQECLVVMFQVQLPVGKIKKAMQMLCSDIPDLIREYVENFDAQQLEEAVQLHHKQKEIREWLQQSDYCAFIGNESVLPRKKGNQGPLEGAVPFLANQEDEIEIAGMKGLGIKRGVTVITGGGYSGKSTILDALFAGIYDHVKGDGREYCITDATASLITTEEGRSIKKCRIQPFITWSDHEDIEQFSTEHASGSTSQAANVIEAIVYGSRLLLVDEDKSAANFLIKDASMSRLIQKEPLVPFSDRVKELFEKKRVSTILVVGGTSAFLPVADQVFLTDNYRLMNVTEETREVCAQDRLVSRMPREADWNDGGRFIVENGFTSYPKGSGSEKLQISELGGLCIGDEIIETKGIHGIVSLEQLNAMAFILRKMENLCEGEADIEELIDVLYQEIDEKGLDIVYSSYFYKVGRFMALPRKQDVYATVKRMREVEVWKRKKQN